MPALDFHAVPTRLQFHRRDEWRKNLIQRDTPATRAAQLFQRRHRPAPSPATFAGVVALS
jgi:hypothetical protein